MSLPRWAKRAVFVVLALVALLAIFRLGSQASAGVALNDPIVWVEDGARGRLLQINGSTREITAQVDIGEDGDSIVALPQGRDAVFFNRTTGVIGVVGAVSLSVDAEDDQPAKSGVIGDQVNLLADYHRDDWVDAFIVDTDRTLVFEPGKSQRLEIRIPEEQRLGDAVINVDGQLVAITGDGEQVGITTPRGLEKLLTLPPLISQDAVRPGLVRAGDSVYLVDAARRVVNEIIGEEELGPTVSICGSPDQVRITGNVLTQSDGDHRILVHDGSAGTLSVSEPGASDCVMIPIELTGDNWGDPVAVDSTAYLPNYDTGQIVVVDLQDRVVTDTFQFRPATGQPFELEVFDGAVWANEPNGFRAAIVDSRELERISKLGTVVLGGEGVDGSGAGTLSNDANEDGPRIFDEEAELFGVPGNSEIDSLDLPGGQAVEALDGFEAETDDPADDPAEDAPLTDEESPLVDETLENVEILDAVDPLDVPEDPVVTQSVETDVIEPEVAELVANFTFTSDTINVGEIVELKDTSTGEPTEWNWDFGDGTSGAGPEVSKMWDSEGVYTVRLLVADADESRSDQTHVFTVVAEDVLRVPSAGFTLSGDTVEVGEVVSFTDTSTGDPETLTWSFGDGSTSTGPQVSHTYSAPGVYTVTLTAANAAGPNSVSGQVTVVDVVQPPVAVIAPFTAVAEVGQTVTLLSTSTNSPTSVSWTFGDGSTALGDQVRYAWDRPGEYRIRLAVSNSAGSSETFANIVVEARMNPPVARFSESALTVVQGEVLRFSDLSLNAPTSLSWDFGDGSNGQGANVTHTWSSPGTYLVSLTATNEAGSDTIAKQITVDPLPPNPPTAAFTFQSASVPVNAVVAFSDSSTGTPTSWSWNFGDNSAASSSQSPTHAFANPGTYTVTLTASNAGGSDSTSRTITVIDPPTASFTHTVNQLGVVFSDTSQNGPTSWAWDFGDGSGSSVQNPTHTYAVAGNYPVKLVTSNNAGSSIVFSTIVTVQKAPEANFSSSVAGLTAQFTDLSIDGPISWSWDFGDGNTSSTPSPSHTYAASNTYSVTLTVSNAAGSDSITKPVSATLAPPVANATCNAVGSGVSCDGSASTSAVSYTWSAPGGTVLNGAGTPTPTFSYPASGSYQITLTVANVEGTTDSTTQTVSVNVLQPPVVSGISVASNSNGVVALSTSASNSPTSYSWSTPGGTITSGAGTASPTITYTTSGTQTVTVTATNAAGTSPPVSNTFTTTIAAPPVITNLAGSNTLGVIPLSATVTNTPVTYAWTTTGGTLSSATAAAPTLTVTANGSYTVGLTVTNADGTDASTTTIVVNDIPIPPPVVAPVTVGAESPAGSVGVSATATNSPTSWAWSVPGSVQGTSTAAAPTFTFTANGTYTGTVTATNAGGTSAPVTFQIVISGFVVVPPPVANFSISTTPGSTIGTFTSTGSDDGAATYSWTLDTTPGSGATVSHDFLAIGTYNVTLTVTDAGGTDTITLPVTIT